MNPRSLSEALLLGVIVIGGIILGSIINPIVAWAFIGVGLIGMMLIGNPRAIIMIWLFWGLLGSLFSHTPVMKVAKWLDELVVVALLGVLLFHAIRRVSFHIQLKRYSKLLAGVVFLLILSLCINASPPAKLAHFFLSYVGGAILFLGISHFYRAGDARRFTTLLYGLFFLQLLLNLGWMFNLNPLYNHWGSINRADFAIGSFGACNYVAYYCCILLILIIAQRLVFISVAKQLFSLLGMVAVVLFQLFITYTTHAYGLLVVSALFFFSLNLSGQAWKKGVFFLAALGVVGGIFWLPFRHTVSGAYYAEQLSSANLQVRWEKMVKGPKGACYKDAFVNAPQEKPHRFLVGAGPGNFMSTVGIAVPPVSPIAYQYLSKYYLTFSGELERLGGSITQHVITGFSAIQSELGIIGLLFYFSLLLYPTVRVVKQVRRNEYRDKYQAALAMTFPAVVVLFLSLNLLTDSLSRDMMVALVWGWAGVVFIPGKDIPQEAVIIEESK